VFVYGTLRVGQGNHRRLLGGRTVNERPCIAEGLAMYGHGIPYAVRSPGSRVVGDLITLDPALYSEVLADLDRLEGYHPDRPDDSHFVRATRTVITNNPLPGGGTWQAFHTAWIYLAGPGVDPASMTRISAATGSSTPPPTDPNQQPPSGLGGFASPAEITLRPEPAQQAGQSPPAGTNPRESRPPRSRWPLDRTRTAPPSSPGTAPGR